MQTEQARVTDQSTSSQPDKAASWLRWSFCVWVATLVFFNFSENTADPDLWGHTLFGQEMIHQRALDRTEPYSWTTHNGPWINHEVLAEVALGASHLFLGGAGLWLLTVLIGLLTFSIALRLGVQNLQGNSCVLAWAIGALAVVEIAFGFAARPQIFTALNLAILFWLLRQIHNGKILLAVALPILFLFWINTHGGALAGIGLLFGVSGATTLQFLWNQYGKRNANPTDLETGKGAGIRAPSVSMIITLWSAFALSVGALFVNPWGKELIVWLFESVSWYRPEIEEWNPPQLGWDHGPMFVLVALGVIAFAFSRRKKLLWEVAVCAVLAMIALRSVRHTPLFSIAALAFIPPHLADVLVRFREQFARLHEMFRERSVQQFIAFLLVLFSAATLYAAVTLRKEHPFTMEVPRDQYPVAAINFIREHEIKGKMLAFFDWGEIVLWELPECSPSIDGRLDTCYSRAVISAHWNFYRGQEVDPSALDIAQADLALLPSNAGNLGHLFGTIQLSKTLGWTIVYEDPLAVILVRNIERFPKLAGKNLPITASKEAVRGREPFPKRNPRMEQSAR